MEAFHFIKGRFLLLFIIAVVLQILLGIFAPDPNGYVWDFYSEAIIHTYQSGNLPSASDCWVCYHPPLLPILGSLVFHIVDFFGGDSDTQLFVVASLLNGVSLIFSIYTFAIYLRIRKHPQLDLILWGLILFLPVRFICSFSVESDVLLASFVVISLYYFVTFLEKNKNGDLYKAAIFIALACLTKYSGVLVALLFAAVLCFRILKSFDKSTIKLLFSYCCIVFFLAGFPYINNLIQTGKPIVGNIAWEKNKGYYTYNFKDFSIPRIIDVFNDPTQAKLKHYYQYNSEVLNSLYGQLWSDFSFFTKAYRHGQHELKFIYQGKYMPEPLLWAILLSGLIPVAVGILGFLMLFFQSDKYIFIFFVVFSLGFYFEWVMGHNYWMLKSKYLLYLLPVWLISISQIGYIINPVILRNLLIPCVFFSSIYCFFFAVF